MKPVLAGLRFFQIIFSVVVLGISITLAKGQGHGAVPATTGYAAFAGAFGILAGLVGVAALFVEFLNGIISWAFDGLAAVVLVAGGIAYAVGLKGAKCSDVSTTYNNKLLNCGTTGSGDNILYYCKVANAKDIPGAINSRCRQATADDVFLFLAFIVTVLVLVASFVWGRKRGGGGSYVM